MTTVKPLRMLRLLCPQQYTGTNMQAVPCTRCSVGWDKRLSACTVDTGCEHLPDEESVPECPMQDHCQHQRQSTAQCVVRRKGLICESALIWSGHTEGEAMDHPLGFSAIAVGE